MNTLPLKFAPLGEGARASARFNLRADELLEDTGLLSFCELKRRERRAPLIPTGLWPEAQGCEARATLGQRFKMFSNPNGVGPSA